MVRIVRKYYILRLLRRDQDRVAEIRRVLTGAAAFITR